MGTVEVDDGDVALMNPRYELMKFEGKRGYAVTLMRRPAESKLDSIRRIRAVVPCRGC